MIGIIEIEQDDRRAHLLAAEERQRLLTVRGHDDVEPLIFEDLGERLPDVEVVVDD